MISGHFDLELINAKGLVDRDFDRAVQGGYINDLLGDLPLNRKVSSNNRVFDNMAGHYLDKLFSMPDCADPYYWSAAAGYTAFTFITLLSTDGEPTYTEDWMDTGYVSIHNAVGTVDDATAGKKFITDQITPYSLWEDTGGREAIHFRNRWLYTTTQANSSVIRSIGIFFSADVSMTWSSSSSYRIARIGRVKLKDSGGNPVTLSKNSNQVLLVEYTYSLVSM